MFGNPYFALYIYSFFHVCFFLLYLLSMLAKVTLLLVDCHWNRLRFFNVIENFKAILKALKIIRDPYLDVLKLFFFCKTWFAERVKKIILKKHCWLTPLMFCNMVLKIFSVSLSFQKEGFFAYSLYSGISYRK